MRRANISPEACPWLLVSVRILQCRFQLYTSHWAEPPTVAYVPTIPCFHSLGLWGLCFGRFTRNPHFVVLRASLLFDNTYSRASFAWDEAFLGFHPFPPIFTRRMFYFLG